MARFILMGCLLAALFGCGGDTTGGEDGPSTASTCLQSAEGGTGVTVTVTGHPRRSLRPRAWP